MSKFVKRIEKAPVKPGKYWVVYVVTDQMGRHYSDGGYACWDGTKWDRDDWDYWYGNVN